METIRDDGDSIPEPTEKNGDAAEHQKLGGADFEIAYLEEHSFGHGFDL